MQEYISLLKRLISTPSLSREEDKAAEVIRDFLENSGVRFYIRNNNTWAFCRHFTGEKPVILLNSHIDTVRPVAGWTTDPFLPLEEGDRITGLGSNDAGGPLVALLAVFLHFYNRDDLPFDLIFSATAEEENSGDRGIRSILDELPPLDLAIVGEPTRMELAVAERGLLVLDGIARGKAGHAARQEGVNAIYKAVADIEILRNYHFENSSELLGPVKISITQIEAGTQHNVVPDVCRFVVDIRTNEFYSNEAVFNKLSTLVSSELKPRSFRLNSSGIPVNHPLVVKARKSGIPLFGSPTTSDQAVIPYPSVKIGPGDSSRSHTADEYILKSEIFEGITSMTGLLEELHLR